MRIVLVQQEPPADGGEDYSALAAAMAELGHWAEFITENTAGKRPAQIVAGRLRVHRLDVAGCAGGEIRPERRRVGFAVEAARRIVELARQGIDIVDYAEPAGAGVLCLVSGVLGDIAPVWRRPRGWHGDVAARIRAYEDLVVQWRELGPMADVRKAAERLAVWRGVQRGGMAEVVS